LSGLAAGIRLAHFGRGVLICERHVQTGGLNSRYLRGGFEIDTGLHAMTNFVPKTGAKSSPLLKLLRQLRIPYDALELREQKKSKISFPQAELEFSNDFELLISEIKRAFPKEMDAFLAFDRFVAEYDALDLKAPPRSARAAAAEYLRDPVLTDMLFAPLSYYGSAVENDMELGQFAIMYRSVFREGFCRPAAGIGVLLSLLEKRFEECGGKILRGKRANDGFDASSPALLLGNGARRVLTENGKVVGVELDSGRVVECPVVLSSAGYHETMELAGAPVPGEDSSDPPGRLGFLEAIALFDDPIPTLDDGHAIIFFNRSERFHYERPENAVDFNSGVVCSPRAFHFEEGDEPPPPSLRATLLANPRKWEAMSREEYASAKTAVAEKALENAAETARLDGGLPQAVLTDCFTPLTIKRFTGKLNGAIYGTPGKRKDGATPVEGLFICGTDQGFLGITGSMLSGISMANGHALR